MPGPSSCEWCLTSASCWHLCYSVGALAKAPWGPVRPRPPADNIPATGSHGILDGVHRPRIARRHLSRARSMTGESLRTIWVTHAGGAPGGHGDLRAWCWPGRHAGVETTVDQSRSSPRPAARTRVGTSSGVDSLMEVGGIPASKSKLSRMRATTTSPQSSTILSRTVWTSSSATDPATRRFAPSLRPTGKPVAVIENPGAVTRTDRRYRNPGPGCRLSRRRARRSRDATGTVGRGR